MAAAPRTRNPRSTRRAARPRLESLESRLVLAASPTAAMVGDTLTVTGTPGPDRISIVPTPYSGVDIVISRGKVLGVFGPAARIAVDAGAGNDVVTVDPRITVPVSLDGNDGNDRLQGGSGPTDLVGGTGNDVLIGSAAHDTYDGGPGLNRLIFQKSEGMIQVSRSVSGASLKALPSNYTYTPLRASGPAIVGPSDLADGNLVNILKTDYDAGQTVAIANATAADATALANLLGDPRPVTLPAGVGRATLVAFRQVNQDGRSVVSSSILLPTANVPTTPAQRVAGSRSIAQAVGTYLGRVFTSTPTITAPPTIADSQSDLLTLAKEYDKSTLQPNGHGDSIQIANRVYAARSFLNSADFYYVDQEVDDTIAAQALGTAGSPPFPPYAYAQWANSVTNSLTGLPSTSGVVTLQPTPATSETSTTETSGVSFSIGGNVGYNAAQGGLGGISLGVTISNSTTKVVPPINITYVGTPANAVTAWNYNIPHQNLPQSPQTLTFYTGWIWQVPFSAYAPGQTALTFDTGANLSYLNPFSIDIWGNVTASNWTVAASATSSVPFPFGTTFALQAPHVTAVTPSDVGVGDNFTITGSGFYPGLVTGLLIGGHALGPDQFSVVSNTQIRVNAPPIQGHSLPVVVQTTVGLSNSDVTINIGGAPQLQLQAQPVSAVAGQAFTGTPVATFSAPGADAANFSATIDWGDGSTTVGTVAATGAGTFAVLGNHTYTAAGSYAFAVHVTGAGTATANGKATVTASGTSGPQNLVAEPITAVAGQAFTNLTVATFAGTDPNPADFTATITWGDGFSGPTTVVTTGAGTFAVLGTHTYVNPGSYPVGIQVTDRGGHLATAPTTATVSAQA